MGRTNDEHLKKLNPTGIPWEEMTEEQQLTLRKEWDKIVSDPKELYCTCPRTGCRNNHNCVQCMSLHRYYDCLTDCLRFVEVKLDEGIPMERVLNTGYKMQNDGNEDSGLVDAHDPDASRARLIQAMDEKAQIALNDKWKKISQNPKNKACRYQNTDCWYHGNCVKCVALHRHYGGVPSCVRYIIDDVEKVADAYWEEQGGKPQAKSDT